MSVTHLAGIAVHIGERVIQRCSICGEKLCDNLNVSVPLRPDGSVPEYATWECGRLVQVDGNRSLMLDDPEDQKLPADSCIELVEA